MTENHLARPTLYLTSRYPLTSQTFIRREVDALRRLDVSVLTASIHRTSVDDVRGLGDAQAQASTWALFDVPKIIVLLRILGVVLRGRSGLTRSVVWSTLGLDARRTALRIAYLLEAVAVKAYCERQGVRHVHVHFANNAADVARYVVQLGNNRGQGELWSWSFTMHGPTEFFDTTKFDLAAKAADAAFVVCISDFARSQLMSVTLPDVWGRFHVVRCGVEPSDYQSVRTHDAASGSRATRILCVGRLVPEKGQHLLLLALAQIRSAGHVATLSLVGDGPSRSSLESIAQDLGLGAAVTFRGAMSPEDVTELYGCHDIFCLASFAEGVPIVLMEAMASGLPVIATRIAGISELVTEKAGILVNPGSVDQLAKALLVVGSDVGLRRSMGIVGRQLVKDGYNINTNSELLATIFRTLR